MKKINKKDDLIPSGRDEGEPLWKRCGLFAHFF
jgi:hypothetical protein